MELVEPDGCLRAIQGLYLTPSELEEGIKSDSSLANRFALQL